MMSVKVVRCNFIFFLLLLLMLVALGQNAIIAEITGGIILVYIIIVIFSGIAYFLHVRQLHEWERTFFLTLNNLHEVIAITDAEYGEVIYVSQALDKTLGYKPDEVLHKPLWEMEAVIDQSAVRQEFMAFRDSLNNKGENAVPLTAVYQTKRKDGNLAYLETTTLPLFRGSNVTRFITTCRDVTERINMEQALSRSEQKYRSIVENSNIPIVIHDEQGKITYANQAVVDQTGITADRFLGTSYWNWVYAQDIPHEKKGFMDKESAPAVYHCRMTLANEDLVHFNIHQTPVYDENGAYQGSIIFAINVDHEAKLTEKLKCQADILDNIPEGVMVLNRDRHVVYANQKSRRLFSIDEDTVLHDTIVESSFGFCQEEIDAMTTNLEQYQIWQGEKSLMINGKEQVYLHRVKLLHGNSTPVIVTSTDITEMVQTRKKAEAANMAKNQFLANISHEVRTPMIGILGSVDLLENSRLDPSQAENLQVIRECGEQLLSIINEILDVTKIEVGLVDLYPEPCDLYDVFAKTISIIEPMLMNKGLSISLDIDHQLPSSVLLDHMKLRQILSNILYNAVKFTMSGGIHIKVNSGIGDEGPFMTVAISDTGIGIPRDKIHSIFDPFTQVDNSSSRLYGGTGLGLYICRQLVELMEGRIWPESQEGYGTTIYFTLPLHPLTESPEPGTLNVETPTVSSCEEVLFEFTPVEILLVEDNPLNQKIVLQMLRNYGFNATVVSNGLECLHILHRQSFGVILMDMQMPVMDGYEATRLIKSDQQLANIPVIAMTANSMTGDREKCLLCGCSDYIAKPFKSEALVQIIRSQLRTTPKQQSDTDNSETSTDFIEQLMPEFIEMLRDMMVELRTAVEQRDLLQVQSISHDIKGTAGMYGLMSISHLAAQVEQNARDYAYQKVSLLIPRLANLVQQASTLVS